MVGEEFTLLIHYCDYGSECKAHVFFRKPLDEITQMRVWFSPIKARDGSQKCGSFDFGHG